MNNKKKFKSLINSITSDRSGMEGTLQKIREMFLEDLLEEVRKVIPETEDKINQLLGEFEKVLSEKESRISIVRDYLNTVDLESFDHIDGKLKDIQKVIKNIDDKIKKLDAVFVKVTTLIEESPKDVQRICDNGNYTIENRLKHTLKELTNAKNNVQSEIGMSRKNTEELIAIWHKSISDRLGTLDQEYSLYMEKEGIKLFTEYIRDNIFRIIWALFIGVFTFWKSKRKSC